MPGQAMRSGLFAKLGPQADARAKEAAKKPVEIGIQRLPGGITNGVFRLTECGFVVQDASTKWKRADGSQAVGEYVYVARGVVDSPESVNVEGAVVRVKGRQTSEFPVALFDTRDGKGQLISKDQGIFEVSNRLKKLGASDADLAQGIGAWEAIAAQLVARGPFCYFSTTNAKASIDPVTKKPRDPKVFENWFGVAEGYVPAGHGPRDASPSANGQEETDQSDPNPEGFPEAPADTGEMDLDALAEVASQEGETDEIIEASKTIKAKALEAGIDAATIDAAESWQAIVELIRGASAGGDEAPPGDAEPEPEPWKPVKGGNCKYLVRGKDGQPVKNPKTKRAYAPVSCEIVSIDAKAKTVKLKSLVDNKTMYTAKLEHLTQA